MLEHYLTGEWLPTVSAVSKRGRALAPTTRQRYSDSVRHVSESIGRVRLSDLRPSHVERVRDRLLSDGLAPQTVSDVLRVLSQALSRAEARGLVGRNPADPKLVHRPTGTPTSFTVIDPALAGAILNAATGQDSWDAAVHLALGLGLRSGRSARPALVRRRRRRARPTGPHGSGRQAPHRPAEIEGRQAQSPHALVRRGCDSAPPARAGRLFTARYEPRVMSRD